MLSDCPQLEAICINQKRELHTSQPLFCPRQKKKVVEAITWTQWDCGKEKTRGSKSSEAKRITDTENDKKKASSATARKHEAANGSGSQSS